MTSHVHVLENLRLLRYYSEQTRFNAIAIKITMVFPAEMVLLILKSIWDCKGH